MYRPYQDPNFLLNKYHQMKLILKCFLFQCATADPDGRKRALLIGGGIANFTDVAATFNGIIRALREKVGRLKYKTSLNFILTSNIKHVFIISRSPN